MPSGQLPMRLSDDATTTSTFRRLRGLTGAWMAFTVRPVSGLISGICSLSTSFAAPASIVVFGATCVGAEITTLLPIARKSMEVMPVDPPQADVDVDVTPRRVILGRVPKVASVTEALDVELPGNPTVVTLAQRPLAVARPVGRPVSFATHGVDVLDEDVVEIKPVSGVGPRRMSGVPRNAVTLADRAYARPLNCWPVMLTGSLPHGEGTGLLLASPPEVATPLEVAAAPAR